jgi:hypothetical protein
VEAVPVVLTNKENDHAAAPQYPAATRHQWPGHHGGPLFGRNYLLFPTHKFRCYFCKIPLLFHCSEKPLFGRKSLKLQA